MHLSLLFFSSPFPLEDGSVGQGGGTPGAGPLITSSPSESSDGGHIWAAMRMVFFPPAYVECGHTKIDQLHT